MEYVAIAQTDLTRLILSTRQPQSATPTAEPSAEHQTPALVPASTSEKGERDRQGAVDESALTEF